MVKSVAIPLLVDADGLNAHARQPELFAEHEGPTVLTPHEGELGRLLGLDSAEIAAHRLRYAREAAERSGSVVLLKGDDTIVAAPGMKTAVSPGGTAALATAGTGDVLSGLIGADSSRSRPRRSARSPTRGRARPPRGRWARITWWPAT